MKIPKVKKSGAIGLLAGSMLIAGASKLIADRKNRGPGYDIADREYKGIWRFDPSSPLRFWVSFRFSNDSSYTCEIAGKRTTKGRYEIRKREFELISAEGDKEIGALTSDDLGVSLKGNIRDRRIWLIRWPEQMVPFTGDMSKVQAHLTDEDCYTCLLHFQMEDIALAATCTFYFRGNNYEIDFIRKDLTEILGYREGNFDIEGKNVVLTTAKNKKIRGDVFNDGDFIRFEPYKVNIPGMGKAMVTILLMR